MKTYYIVKTSDYTNNRKWQAHNSGILSAFNVFNTFNEILFVSSYTSADDCELNLRNYLASQKIKPVIVRVVKI